MQLKTKFHTNELAFKKAQSILPWNRNLLTVMGVWPKSPSIIRFGTAFIYYLYCLSLIYLSFFLAFGSFRKVLRCLSEIITFTQVFYRLITLKRFNREFGDMLEKIKRDLNIKNYHNEKEMKQVLSYNRTCKFFCRLLVYCLGCTVLLYFFKPLLLQLGNKLTAPKNVTVPLTYELPQRFYSFYKVDSLNVYIFTYIFQMPFAFTNNFVQASMDCLTLTLTYHLCGQLAVLSSRIEEVGRTSLTGTKSLSYHIRKHQELLRTGHILAKSLESCLLVHLVGASVLICILVYNILFMLAIGQKTGLVTFFVYGSLNVARLFTHCHAGEYLIHESLGLIEAYYNCKWYELTIEEQHSMIMCMKRSQKPMKLLAGKFGTMSLTSFGEVIKTAMGYLSVLRTVI